MRAPGRHRARGLTLVEVLIVVTIVSLLMAGVLAGSGQTSSARLKRASAMIVAAVKTAYTRAAATSRNVRIVFDFDKKSVWLEESELPMFVQSKDLTGAAGADPSSDLEKRALAEAERFSKGTTVQRARFVPIKTLGFDTEGLGAKELGRGITFREIQTGHDDEPRTSGRAYLYFWPGGQTERASIQVRVGTSLESSQTLTVTVSPLTGKSVVELGSVPLKRVETDRDASEREDRGF